MAIKQKKQKKPTSNRSTTKAQKVEKKKVNKRRPVKIKKRTSTTAKKTSRTKKKYKTTSYLGEENFLANIKSYKLKKTEKYMNVSQKKHFVAILEIWKNLLMAEQDLTADKLQKNAPNFPDEADRATHEEGFTLELKTRERERRLLNKIDSSLEAIKDNIYGYCNSCGIEIGIRRLEARPTATRCIDCKTLEEIHERQQYG